MYSSKKNIYILIAIFIISVILIFPYWVFGSYSMVGWYDEYNAVIPWYLNILNYNDYQFLHGYAGGASSKQAYLEGNEEISLIRFLFEYFDFWIGNTLFRVAGYTLGIYSLYYLIRESTKLSQIQALNLSSAGFIINFIPYGWMLASMGYGFFGIIIFTYYYFDVNRFTKTSIVIPLCSFIIVSVTTPPVFLFAQLGYFCLAYSFLFNKSLNPKNSYRIFLIFSLILIEMLNWLEGIYFSTIQTQNFTARLIDPLNAINGLSYAEIITKITLDQIVEFLKFIQRDPHYLLLIIYLLSISILIYLKKYTYLLKIIFVFFALPLIFEITSKLAHIPLLAQFQFHTLWEVHSLILVLIIATNINEISLKWKKNVIYLLVIFSSVLAFEKMTVVTLDNLNLYGGGGTFFHYQSLANLKINGSPGRVVSNGYLNPHIPNLYGLDTFDGVPHISPKLRVDFDAYALKVDSNANSSVNHAWRIYPTFPKGYHIELFSMANVTHLISKFPIIDDRFLLLEYEKGKTTHDYSLLKYFKEINLAPDIYIYKLIQMPWPLAFTPKKIIPSHSINYDFEYFNQIKKLNFGEVLVLNTNNIDSEVETSYYRALSYIKTKNGYLINQINDSKFVVINTVYTPYWKGKCNGNKVELFPANGIMMIAHIPNKCKTLELTYETLNLKK